MPAFFRELPELTHLYCCWHLDKNVRAAVPHKGYHAGQFWDIQDAETEEMYQSKLKVLAHTSKSAANYISDISKERWVSFSVFEKFGVHSHGYKTNGQVEQVSARPLFIPPPLFGFHPPYSQANGKFAEARTRSPIEMAEAVILMTNEDLQLARASIAETNGNGNPSRLLTPHADKLFMNQVRLAKREGIGSVSCSRLTLEPTNIPRRKTSRLHTHLTTWTRGRRHTSHTRTT